MRFLLVNAVFLMTGLLFSGLSINALSNDQAGIFGQKYSEREIAACFGGNTSSYACPSNDCNKFVYTVEIAEATEHEVHREKLLKKKDKASTWMAGVFFERAPVYNVHWCFLSGRTPDPHIVSDQLHLVLRVLRI